MTRIKDANMAVVMTEDGFEIPTLMKDLVVESPLVESGENKEQDRTPRIQRIKAEDQVKGIYLAFVNKPGTKVAGAADLFLINNTPYDVLYNILKDVQGQYIGFDYGSMGPRSAVMIQECPEDANDRVLKGMVQILYHPLEAGRFLRPLSSSFKMKAQRLLDEENYQWTSFFENSALLIYLGLEDESGLIDKPIPAVDHSENLLKKRIAPYTTAEGEAVIDLHLEVLLEDTRRVSPAEALQIQMGHFEAILHAAVKSSYSKLIFIHGVGNGILKSEIRKKLSDMDGVVYYDAPMSQYGVGATEVRLP